MTKSKGEVLWVDLLTLSNTPKTVAKRHLAEEVECVHFEPLHHIDALLAFPAQWADLSNKCVCASLYDVLLRGEGAGRKGRQKVLLFLGVDLQSVSHLHPKGPNDADAYHVNKTKKGRRGKDSTSRGGNTDLGVPLTPDTTRLETRSKHVVEITFDVVRLARRRETIDFAVRLERGEAEFIGGYSEDITYVGMSVTDRGEN